VITATTTPPAIHASAKPCADYTPVNLHVLRTTTAISPDCDWAVVSIGDDDIKAGKNHTSYRLPKLKENTPYRAFVIERRTGRIVYHFEMEHSAQVHWLKDNSYLVVNYLTGGSLSTPLFFTLKSDRIHQPSNLANLIRADVERRANQSALGKGKGGTWLYHYYVDYIEDDGAGMTIAAETTLAPDEAHNLDGTDKCYVYRVSKTTLRYRFVRESDIDNCPRNPDEKWN